MTLERMTPAEIADDYVLGLLDPADAAEVERRLEGDAELAALVAEAQERVLEVDVTATPVEPGSDLWGRILTGIDDGAGDSRETPLSAPDGGAPSSRRPRRTGPRRGRDRSRLPGPVRHAASILVAVALMAFGAVAGRILLVPEPLVVAVLLNDAGEPFALIEGQADNTTRVSVLADAEVSESQVLQLWTKPDADGPPVSLGIFESPTSVTLKGEDLPPPSPQQLYEITVEQAGGSPTGLPTGPILGKGLATQPR